MNEIGIKLKLLSELLDKKAELLEQIYSITEKQEMFFKKTEGEDRQALLSGAAQEKQKIIDELKRIDDVFLSVFEGFNGALNENKRKYAEEIKTLKEKIKIITGIDIKIRVKEERNRMDIERMSVSGALGQPKIKALKASKSYMLSRYKQNSGKE